MEVITDRVEMNRIVKNHKYKAKTIGFVPTMGFLHEGHLSLVKKAKQDNDITIMSIFVNPTQFGPNEDFETYPRDFERDRRLAENAGVNYLFAPSVDEMYPNEMGNQLSVMKRTNVLCGKSREGHFDGVITVLSKLFHIVIPDKAYFGKKDAQQIAVVEGLVHDYFFPIEIVAVETVREKDGLAKSSRNVYLSVDERREAPALYKSLELAKNDILNGEKSPAKIREKIKEYIQKNTSGIIDYIEIYSYPALEPIANIHGKVIIALAVKFSKARLIDNIIMELEQ
ncbi:pantoate--beta-alanine ligase [Heyndrickxia sporothermodurans]|uniref:pantoate--beta-alanine ligase n=1 Tax=Heyndrickxia sporothermodurans TaxID=46224 RepID=UPI002E23657A|nr:pantoate--beta-alanine ligase [Heyndrickxia sporothermodurans]MED3654046.1 pantoate--beta-alanine ligase [Heyndrickxia sporothermodurans]MED3780952.1 pantoate--beta-alanine ligase [Heyndrickxia sporothermodurans]